MATAITPLHRRMFLWEIEKLCFSVTPGTERCELKVVSASSGCIFENSYIPDPQGNVTVYDIDRLLLPYIPEVYETFGFYVDGIRLEEWDIKVFRCSSAINKDAEDWVDKYFLTPVTGQRDTSFERIESLFAYLESPVNVYSACRYWNGSKVVERTLTLETDFNGGYIDASATRMANSTIGVLLSYTVTCGWRKARFRVVENLPESDPAVIFRNCFNCFEPLYLTGLKEVVGNYTRSSAMVDGRYSNYAIDEVISYKAQTGPLRPAVIPLAMDFARTREAYLLNPDNSRGRGIVITDCDVKHHNGEDSIPNLTFTYRLSSRLTWLLEVAEYLRIFDGSFDLTFE